MSASEELRAEYKRRTAEIDAWAAKEIADIPRRTAQMWSDAFDAFNRQYRSWPWWKRWAYDVKGLFTI